MNGRCNKQVDDNKASRKDEFKFMVEGSKDNGAESSGKFNPAISCVQFVQTDSPVLTGGEQPKPIALPCIDCQEKATGGQGNSSNAHPSAGV